MADGRAEYSDIVPMDGARAREYLAWEYPPPYAFYNTPPHALAQALAEIEEDNGMDFYAVLDDTGAMVGMFEYKFPAGVMEIGLGLVPEGCGQGLGAAFVRRCVEYGRQRYGYGGPITLRVADFNQRSIKLYTRLGFVETARKQADCYGAPVTFIHMVLQGPAAGGG